MMTILIINDLSESKTLDKEALRSVRGGNFYCGDIPVNIEEILGIPFRNAIQLGGW